MSDVSLALKNICISSSNDKLRLFVASSMSFKCSELSFESFNNTEILQLLLSRDVWVCRGNGCSFNFSILANGHPLPEECRNSLLGGLGAYLRDNTVRHSPNKTKKEVLNWHSSGRNSPWKVRLRYQITRRGKSMTCLSRSIMHDEKPVGMCWNLQFFQLLVMWSRQ